MFGDIDAYSATLRGAQLGARGIASPALFEHQKKSDFWKKSPDCVHLWVKFFIQNVVLRVYGRKKMFPWRASFWCF